MRDIATSGTICKFSDEHCIDMEGGHTFWSALPREDCLKTKYDVLYRGLVTKLTSNNREILYTIETTDISFALAAKGDIKTCNRILTKTEHPRLIIYKRTQNNILFDNSPDEFAYNLMEKPGYIARIAGEVVHIIKCTPKEVQLLHTDKCYTQLPVTSGNQTRFLTPKTHILMKSGTQIECNTIIPQYYKLNNNWIALTPTPRKAQKPGILKPNTNISWEYKEINSLASSGIYSQEDLQELQQYIMFALEKSALLNTIARGMLGEESVQGGLINNLFTENTLSHIAENTWNKFVEKFIKFGSISSAVIMILIIIHICKLIIDTIIREYTLHTVYGWFILLLGAIFSSITYLLGKTSKGKTPN
ncbi:uncharacterized protein LOC143305528 [Osmia lignaria lignaria]|uniref:uncharacterized protein LOC143305528 n=1 Tax=Osmia lignaria lignaria TaxID=1437193 RepID=UPI00402B4DBA